MSGTRRTEDFNAVKTRQLILINPDGSFPVQGQLIGVTDSRGTLGPTPNPVFGHLSADTLTLNTPIQQNTVTATTVSADTVRTNTLDIINRGGLTTYDLCANRIETVYLTVTDVSADCIKVDTIYPRQIGSAARMTEVANVVQVNATDINATISMRTPWLIANLVDAQDVSANSLDTERITTTDLATNTISRAETITTLALNVANTANINRLTVTNSANISNLITTDISSSFLNVRDATVSGTLITSGTLTPANINTTGTITADRIRSNDISSNSIYAGNATFASLSVTTANIDISGLNYPSLSANYFTGGQVNVIGKLTTAGSTELNDVSASSLVVSGGTILKNTTASQITAPTINANNLIVGSSSAGAISTISMYDTKPANIGLIPNPGILTYDVSNGLLLNGLLVSTTAAFGKTVPFSLVTATNNLATVADLTATMFDLINSYNAFLTLFSNAKLMIQLTPVVNFLSPCSIQFVINNVTQPPLILFGKYTLSSTNIGTTTLMSTLTAAALNVIQFTASPNDNNEWTVRISMPTGTNNYISDVTGMPTGSLQVLRYLGFTVPTGGPNPYETYALTGPIYTRTSTPLTAPYTSNGAILPSLIQYTNNLPNILYNVSGDPYSLPITFTNLVSSTATQYLAIKYNGVYTLYPKTNPLITFSGLTPNTGYDFTFNYLDLSNNSYVSPSLFTTKIPAPSDVSANTNDISFNAFTLRWTQPYPGRTYTFTLDASGQNITSGTTAAIFYTFYPLVQNTQYRITVTSVDPNFTTKPSDPSNPIIVTTKPLTVPTPVISAAPNSNITAAASWSPPVTGGASGKLEYYVNRGALNVYNISGSTTSYIIPDLSGTGDISGSLIYTDNNYNTIRGAIATYRYDASFGFFDMSATDLSQSIIILNNTTLNGVGYVLPTPYPNPTVPSNPANPWVGYSFNRITFPQGIIEPTGAAVSFRANIYNIVSAGNIGALYSGPSYTVSSFDLSNNYGPPISSSNTVILDASSTPYLRYPVLTFTNPVKFTANTMLMFEIVAGSGAVQFSTFLNSPPNTSNKIKYATSIAYNRSLSKLYNWSFTSLSYVICQFNYI